MNNAEDLVSCSIKRRNLLFFITLSSDTQSFADKPKLAYLIGTVQDFLIKLDMKPCMHLVEISIFSLNHVIIRLTKVTNVFENFGF